MQTGIPTFQRRARILEVLFSFRVGGSEIVGLELAHGLSQTGAEVMCSAIDGMDGPLRDRCNDLRIPVIDLGLPARGVLRRNGFSTDLVKRMRALQLDAIHVHHFVAHNKLSIPARIAGIPRIVVTEHSDADLRSSVAGRLRLRANWRLANRITVIHEGLKQYLVREIHVDPSRISVIPNGIDSGYWNRNDRDLRREAMGLGNQFTFIYVGRLVPVKNVPQLIISFLDAHRQSQTPTRLIIVGDGPEMDECKRIAATDPCGQSVTFVGEQKDTRQFLAAGDAFILNSHSEGTPRALLEAMCLGLPAICPSVGGIPELLKGCGWLTEAENPQSVVAAMLAASGNPSSSTALGQRGRSFVKERYDAGRTTIEYGKLLLPQGVHANEARP